MRMPFTKADPIVDASASVDTLAVRHARLAERLAAAVERVEAAQAARLAALVDGDPTPAEIGKLDRACLDAAGARAGLDDAVRAVTAQLEEATRTRDELTGRAAIARIAAEAERRASALDAAAEALAGAAKAFNDARAAMVTAVATHGVRVDHPLSTDGSVPASLVARPIVQAALRMAAPSMYEAVSGLGAFYDSDPMMVTRRGQSGLLRDHAEDLNAGKALPIDLPRPGEKSAVDPSNPLTTAVPMVRGVARVPLAYRHPISGRLVQVEAGSVELPPRVLEVAIEADFALAADNLHAAAVLRELNKPPVPGYLKTPGRPGQPFARFVDIEAGEIVTPRTSDTPPNLWPDTGSDVRPAYAGARPW